MPSSDLVISATALSKSFEVGIGSKRKTFEALKQVSLEVPRGISFGFLGPNGAGKTTTIKILTGLIFPSEGAMTVLGGQPSDPKVRARFGYLPENPSFPDHLTGAEVLRFTGELLGTPRTNMRAEVDRVLGVVDLLRAADIQTRKYSKGMVQRLGIAQALMNNPELVILDEPMSGLDPIGRRDVKDLIVSLRKEGRTVFFSTHIIADVEEICDEIAMVAKGKIVRKGSVNELAARAQRETDIVATGVPEGFEGAERRPSGETVMRVSEARVRETIERIWALGGQVVSVRVSRTGLEDMFMEEVRKEAS